MLLKLGASPSTVRTDGVSAFGMKYVKSRAGSSFCENYIIVYLLFLL